MLWFFVIVVNRIIQYYFFYFNEIYVVFCVEVCEWVEIEVEFYVIEWDEKKEVFVYIYKQMGECGYFVGFFGIYY